MTRRRRKNNVTLGERGLRFKLSPYSLYYIPLRLSHPWLATFKVKIIFHSRIFPFIRCETKPGRLEPIKRLICYPTKPCKLKHRHFTTYCRWTWTRPMMPPKFICSNRQNSDKHECCSIRSQTNLVLLVIQVHPWDRYWKPKTKRGGGTVADIWSGKWEAWRVGMRAMVFEVRKAMDTRLVVGGTVRRTNDKSGDGSLQPATWRKRVWDTSTLVSSG